MERGRGERVREGMEVKGEKEERGKGRERKVKGGKRRGTGKGVKEERKRKEGGREEAWRREGKG